MSSKRLPNRRSLISTKRHSASKLTLLQLPVELILEIWAHLSLDGKCLFALTCKKMYSIAPSSIWRELDIFPPKYSIRLSKSYLLRGIQKDRNDPSIYVCYTCLRFHRIIDPEPTQPRYLRDSIYFSGIEHQVGYPNCRSEYMRGMREILGQLGNPSKENKLEVYKSRQLKSPVHMVYTLTSGVDGKDVFTLRKYTMRAKEEKYSNYFMVPSYFLRTANLEICRHTSFGHDYVKGDGSINDYLHRYYLDQHKAYFSAIACGQVWQPQPFSGYVCQECRLEVEIRFRGIEVEILVWQDIGASRKSNWGAKVTRLMGMKLGMESARAEERMRSGLKPGVLRKKWEGLKHKGG